MRCTTTRRYSLQPRMYIGLHSEHHLHHENLHKQTLTNNWCTLCINHWSLHDFLFTNSVWFWGPFLLTCEKGCWTLTSTCCQLKYIWFKLTSIMYQLQVNHPHIIENEPKIDINFLSIAHHLNVYMDNWYQLFAH